MPLLLQVEGLRSIEEKYQLAVMKYTSAVYTLEKINIALTHTIITTAHKKKKK